MSDLANSVDTLARLIKHANIDQYEASISESKSTSTAVRLGTVDSLQKHLDKSFSISVYQGGKKGNASSVDCSPDGLKKTIEAAKTIAQYTSDDPFVGLAPKERMAWQVEDLDLYHPWQLNADESIDIASRCEQAALKVGGVDNSEGAEVSTFEGHSYYLNSTGLVVDTRSSRHELYCSAIAQGKKEMQTAYDYSTALDKNDLSRPEAVGERAAKQALDKLGADKLNSQKCPIIFSAEIASGLFHSLFSAISGTRQYNKNTFLLDQLGNKIFPQWLNIEEIPRQKKTIGASAYDGDGVATQRQFFIKDGCLERYALGQYSANQLKLSTTANAGGIHHCVISHNVADQTQLLKQMGTGVLITELMGQGVDVTNGNYSRGASGFWVEGGKICSPVSGFTVAANLAQMFTNIVGISADVDCRKTIKCGSVLVDEVTIAGN